jgi:hypothetical protein
MDEPADQERIIAAEPNGPARRSTVMRLVLSALILIVTTLDFNFGHPGSSLHIAGLVAGILLAGTVLVDYLWLDRLAEGDTPRRKSEPHQPLHTSGTDP